ncbi:MAG: sporulation protein [Clostridiales bacterium]|nr:MAG: sporulation protein [Clostridiales bacterium]
MLKKNKIVGYLSFFITLIGFIGLLIFTSECLSAAKKAIDLCTNVIIPSLFPFFVFSSMFISSGVCEKTQKPLGKIMRPLFNVSGSCAAAFVLGLLSGFPVGAKTAVSLYERGLCTKSEAERVLAFCNNAGPFFILGTVGVGIWQSSEAGWILWGSQAISAILTGMIFGHLWKRHDHPPKTYAVFSERRSPLLKSFYSAVGGGAKSMVPICAFIIFFAVIVALLQSFGFIGTCASFLSKIFPVLSEKTTADILSGFFEMTTGISSLGNGTPLVQGLTLTGALLGWAGLSVHCQVLSFVYESGLSTRPYFYGKLMQTAFSTAITFLFSMFFTLPAGKDVFVNYSASGVSALSPSALFALCSAVSVFLLSLFLIISEVTSKKIRKRS